MIYVALSAAAALAVTRPLAVRLLPDDIAGPDGWYFDTVGQTGILDFPLKRR